MYTTKRTYTDFDGNQRTETFYFNLTKAELLEMELSTSGGFAEHVQRIYDAQDIPQLIAIYKQLILNSYGEKSPDGKYFIKNKNGHKLADDFAQTPVYSDMFMEFATDIDAATKFITAVFPEAENNPEAQKKIAEFKKQQMVQGTTQGN